MSQHKDRSELMYTETTSESIDACPWHSALDLVDMMTAGPRGGEGQADFLSRMAHLLVERSGIDHVAIYRRRDADDGFQLLAATDDGAEECDGDNQRPIATLIAAAIEGDGLFWRHGDRDMTDAASRWRTSPASALPPDRSWRSLVVQPLKLGDVAVGAMAIASVKHDLGDEETRRILRIAGRLLGPVVADESGLNRPDSDQAGKGAATGFAPAADMDADGLVDWTWETDETLTYVRVSPGIPGRERLVPG